jgi:hypothetical protein
MPNFTTNAKFHLKYQISPKITYFTLNSKYQIVPKLPSLLQTDNLSSYFFKVLHSHQILIHQY